jgi:hypothetical protein
MRPMNPYPTDHPSSHELHRWARRQRSAAIAVWCARAFSAARRAVSQREALGDRLEHGPARH